MWTTRRRPAATLGGIGAICLSVTAVAVLVAVRVQAADTGYQSPTAAHAPNQWTNPTFAFGGGNTYATTTADNAEQGYSAFS